MIKDVLTIGNAKLTEVSQELGPHEFNSLELNSLVQDLLDTMTFKGGVGISAVQIGVLKRVALIGYDDSNARYRNIGSQPLIVVINPTIEVIGNEVCEYNEGCLSLPNERGMVVRPKKIRYKFYDEKGNMVSGESDGFFARVFQHELDHMDGILFPMRIEQNIIKVDE